VNRRIFVNFHYGIVRAKADPSISSILAINSIIGNTTTITVETISSSVTAETTQSA
jgi:hypothetical protein